MTHAPEECREWSQVLRGGAQCIRRERVRQLSAQMASFGARDVLYALKDLAKSLSSIPGRKTVILITGGFPLTPEIMSEATATISACNKANVAIYPIDVRGLVAGTPAARLNMPNTPGNPDRGVRFVLGIVYRRAAWRSSCRNMAAGGGGGGGTGGGGGGGRWWRWRSVAVRPGRRYVRLAAVAVAHPGPTGPTGGTTGGQGGVSTGGRPGFDESLWNQLALVESVAANARMIIPQLPDSTTTNQNIMFMLAEGTGGFVIHETNDLIGGMEKIGKEQDEYYVLGYTPPDSEEGSCHTLRVKVDRSGTEVRARTGYCNSKPQDLLAGNSTEKDLETRAAAAQAGNVSASMQLPYFYTAPNVARVNVAMEIATDNVKFDKEKGKYHATVNILGLAYLPDGSVGARFSDALKIDFDDKKQMEAFKENPMHYENQFDVASGKYNLKVVFASSGESFGKVEMPLGSRSLRREAIQHERIGAEQTGAPRFRSGNRPGCAAARRSRAADRQRYADGAVRVQSIQEDRFGGFLCRALRAAAGDGRSESAAGGRV